jgi:hypothetical protein
MIDWQTFIYFEHSGFVFSPGAVVLVLVLSALLLRSVRKRKRRLKPLKRPNREPYNPETFRR